MVPIFTFSNYVWDHLKLFIKKSHDRNLPKSSEHIIVPDKKTSLHLFFTLKLSIQKSHDRNLPKSSERIVLPDKNTSVYLFFALKLFIQQSYEKNSPKSSLHSAHRSAVWLRLVSVAHHSTALWLAVQAW